MGLIAIVDDNPGARRFVAAAVQKAGHEVLEIEPVCLYRVLEALHDTPPDLLIMDITMAGCPGKTLIRACREDIHIRQLRILVLTSYGDSDLGHFLQAMDNIHYLAKPTSPADLMASVDELLNPDQETDPGWALACKGVVAVVDDSNLTRLYHAACLRKQGYRPVQVEPTELLATVLAIEEAQPDLLVVDYLMPRFNGDALIRALRAREALRGIPVLVVTAHHSEELFAQLQPLSDLEIRFKPISSEALVEQVDSLLQATRI